MKREATSREVNLIYEFGSSKVVLAYIIISIVTGLLSFISSLNTDSFLTSLLSLAILVLTSVEWSKFYMNCNSGIREEKPLKILKVVYIIKIVLSAIAFLALAFYYIPAIKESCKQLEDGESLVEIFNVLLFYLVVYLAFLIMFTIFLSNILSIIESNSSYEGNIGIITGVLSLVYAGFNLIVIVSLIKYLDSFGSEVINKLTSVNITYIYLAGSALLYGVIGILILKLQLELNKNIFTKEHEYK